MSVQMKAQIHAYEQEYGRNVGARKFYNHLKGGGRVRRGHGEKDDPIDAKIEQKAGERLILTRRIHELKTQVKSLGEPSNRLDDVDDVYYSEKKRRLEETLQNLRFRLRMIDTQIQHLTQMKQMKRN